MLISQLDQKIFEFLLIAYKHTEYVAPAHLQNGRSKTIVCSKYLLQLLTY